MTTYAERWIITRDARLDPTDPDFEAPADTTEPAVQGAVALFRRIQSALIDVAHDCLSVPIGGATGDQRTAIYWAQAVVANPAGEARKAFDLLLARFDELQPAQLPSVTDESLKTAIEQLVPQLSLGFPRR